MYFLIRAYRRDIHLGAKALLTSLHQRWAFHLSEPPPWARAGPGVKQVTLARRD